MGGKINFSGFYYNIANISNGKESSPTKYKELKLILDRSKSSNDAAKIYTKHIDLLIDLVNYGSNLIVRAFGSRKERIEDVIVIGVLLKQVVQMVDSVQILLSAGAAHTALLQARAAFESYLYMLWIMQKDSEKRAKFYYVSSIRKQKFAVLRHVPNTKERTQFEKIYKDFDEQLKSIDDSLKDIAKKEVDKFDEFLNEPGWKEINDTFERIRKKYFYWYEVLGVKSIAQLASDVGESQAYDLYYSKWGKMDLMDTKVKVK